MAKKRVGKLVALTMITGAVAAGISYFLKYKSFNKELNEEFHDFEGELDDEEFDGSLPHENEAAERSYVSLGDKKAEPVSETEENAAEETATEEAVADPEEKAAEEVTEDTVEISES